MQKIENTGNQFSKSKFLGARESAWSGLNNLAASIKPGDTEEKIAELYLSFFPSQSKAWHPPKIRFGHDTICTFRQKSIYRSPIEEGDLFFFDFGPVIDEHEADVGDTFCLGKADFLNPAKEVFLACESLWQEEGLTGKELYEQARNFASKRELKLNESMHGHRLGDFPHALHHKGSLENIDFPPKELLWVLEIHLIDEKKNVGYFYEDILAPEKSLGN